MDQNWIWNNSLSLQDHWGWNSARKWNNLIFNISAKKIIQNNNFCALKMPYLRAPYTNFQQTVLLSCLSYPNFFLVIWKKHLSILRMKINPFDRNLETLFCIEVVRHTSRLLRPDQPCVDISARQLSRSGHQSRTFKLWNSKTVHLLHAKQTAPEVSSPCLKQCTSW